MLLIPGFVLNLHLHNRTVFCIYRYFVCKCISTIFKLNKMGPSVIYVDYKNTHNNPGLTCV